jgi:hypothetical protein
MRNWKNNFNNKGVRVDLPNEEFEKLKQECAQMYGELGDLSFQEEVIKAEKRKRVVRISEINGKVNELRAPKPAETPMGEVLQ